MPPPPDANLAVSTPQRGNDPDIGVVAAAMKGDDRALDAVWAQNRRWIAAILLAHKPRWAEVEDLLQDVGATLVRKIGELREPAALKPWLRTVAINAARAAARDKKKLARHAAAVLEDTAESGTAGRVSGGDVVRPGPAGRAEAREEAARLMDLAMQLPEGYREPLLLRCVRDLSYKQIGELVGLPETTIETRIARGRRMLRELASANPRPAAEPAPSAHPK